MSEIDTGYFNYYERSLMFHGSLVNIMGTKFDIIIIGKTNNESEEIWIRIEQELRRLNFMMNRFDPASEISKINSQSINNEFKVSDEMWCILNNCKYYHEQTLGLFDITLKDFNTIQFNKRNKTISFSKSNIQLDLGGYAKGYGLKKIQKILEAYNIDQCFVNFGNSSILGIGNHPFGDAWKVSIENPFNINTIVDEISISNASLSVSGNTPSYSRHVVIPKSGKSEVDNKLVSVLMHDPLDAEVLSTAFLIASKIEREQLIDRFRIIKAREYKL